MGLTVSRCADAPAPPPVVAPGTTAAPGSVLPAAAQAAVAAAAAKKSPKVDYMELPCPVKYEELQREAMMSLKPECFEGCRFDFTKPLNQKFSLQHSLFMGSVEVPAQGEQVLKIPAATYEFGANLFDNNTLMIGRVCEGRLSARVNLPVGDALLVKIRADIMENRAHSQGMLDVDYKGLDWQGQLKVGNQQFFGANYLQSVTPTLALGGEAFWLGAQRKSGAGFAFRNQGSKGVSTGQVATTGLLSLSYVHRVSDKVGLATDFLWNWNSKEVTATVGYDYMLRQCRLRGKIDSNGLISAYLEEQLNVGIRLLVSAEVDHAKKDYRFGFGMTVGE